MNVADSRLIASPTDLGNFLACRYKTALDGEAARGLRQKPTYVDPMAAVLRQRGQEHEDRHVATLKADGLTVVDLTVDRGAVPRPTNEDLIARTVAAMRAGADIIVQAALGDSQWFGYADVLVRVNVPSPNLGTWSYEVHDTKLSRETRATAILQLCVYTELIAGIQGHTPERFQVVTPAESHVYRFDEVAAYYRLVKAKFLATIAELESTPQYPDPVEHCGVCRWWQVCDTRRRADDHLQFVANLGRGHKRELEPLGISTLTSLAKWDVPASFRPSQGARETFVKLQDQATLQLNARETGQLTFKVLPIEPHVAEDGTPLPRRGLKRLPAPSPGDLYLDLEGDPFARTALGGEAGEGSREYLFGLGSLNEAGEFQFRSWWAFTDQQEQTAFEEVMDEIARVVALHPDAHVYHYAPYEPSAFKRLSGRYATRAEEMDVLLRAGRLVDLYAVVRQSIRAGIESYSIKEMEAFYGFTRDIDLRKAGQERQAIEIALETGDLGAISQDIRDAVEGYNRDDVRSTWALQTWLEARRDEVVASGVDVPRPVPEEGEASEEIKARALRVRELRARLLGPEPCQVDPASPHYLMAFLLDWHRREDKSEWWEFFRLRDLEPAELLDERKGIAGLEYVARVEAVLNKRTHKPTGSVIDRYRFPAQDCDVDPGDALRTSGVAAQWADVTAIDRQARTIDVKVGETRIDERPTAAFVHDVIPTAPIEDALFDIGTRMAEGAVGPLTRSLLARVPPPMPVDITTLMGGVYAIQGPPGTGKTYRGGGLICDLVATGKTVGVTAHSHAVIRNMMRAVRKEAEKRRQAVPMHQIKNEDEFCDASPRVVGGTTWHWCGKKAAPVDVLVVDEAGQMSLANTLACTRIAGALVLLGDPQQLDQPTKGVHPPGVGVSALQHWLGAAHVMPVGHGGFLDITWRLAPSICDFTSETFYEGRLQAKPNLEHQVLRGCARFSGAGLRTVPVAHDGNRNASDEEVTEVVRIVADLLAPGSEWVDEHGVARQLTPQDLRIVAPYNAQVSRIQEALSDVGVSDVGRGLQPRRDIPVGTVDKFQGQEAPVVIYSMATSRPEDAPRGLGFLYSLNRFNVATSRARCMCILVASPKLFEPDCQTAPQLLLANALCRYVELSPR